MRVAALAEPTADAADWAKGQWDGPGRAVRGRRRGADRHRLPVRNRPQPRPGSKLFSNDFWTWSTRRWWPSPATCRAALRATTARCSRRSGNYDLTVTFGALKPAHRLMPAMAQHGPGRAGRHRHRGRRQLVRDRRARTCRRSTRRATNMAAGWSIAWPARCPAPSRWPRPLPRRVRRRLCPGLDLAADRRAARRRSSRPAARTFRTSGSAASWSGRAWAICRRY